MATDRDARGIKTTTTKPKLEGMATEIRVAIKTTTTKKPEPKPEGWRQKDQRGD